MKNCQQVLVLNSSDIYDLQHITYDLQLKQLIDMDGNSNMEGGQVEWKGHIHAYSYALPVYQLPYP